MKINNRQKNELYRIVRQVVTDMDIVVRDDYDGVFDFRCYMCGHSIPKEEYNKAYEFYNHNENCIYVISVKLLDEIEGNTL